MGESEKNGRQPTNTPRKEIRNINIKLIHTARETGKHYTTHKHMQHFSCLATLGAGRQQLDTFAAAGYLRNVYSDTAIQEAPFNK